MDKQTFFERYCVKNLDNQIYSNLADPTITAFIDNWKKTRLMCINMALEELPIKQRKVIVYLFEKSLPIETIAQKLGLSPKAISSIKRRAINNLKQNILLKFFIKQQGG